HFITRLWFILALPLLASAQDWGVYGGDAGGTRYSPLKQINRANVAALRPAWTYCSVQEITGQLFPPFSRARTGRTGLDHLQRAPAPRQFLGNGFDSRRPYKWFWILVPRRQECIDGRLQIFHTAENSTTDGLLIQLPKPTLDQI